MGHTPRYMLIVNLVQTRYITRYITQFWLIRSVFKTDLSIQVSHRKLVIQHLSLDSILKFHHPLLSLVLIMKMENMFMGQLLKHGLSWQRLLVSNQTIYCIWLLIYTCSSMGWSWYSGQQYWWTWVLISLTVFPLNSRATRIWARHQLFSILPHTRQDPCSFICSHYILCSKWSMWDRLHAS